MKIIIYGENKERQQRWRKFLSNKYQEVEIESVVNLETVLEMIMNQDVIMVIINIESSSNAIADLQEIKSLIKRTGSDHCEVVCVANPSNNQLINQLSGIASLKVGRREEDANKITELLDRIISRRTNTGLSDSMAVDFASRIARCEESGRGRDEAILKLTDDLSIVTKAIYGGIGNVGMDDRLGRLELSNERLVLSWREFESKLNEEMSKRIWQFIFYPAVMTIKSNPTAAFTAITAAGSMGILAMKLFGAG